VRLLFRPLPLVPAASTPAQASGACLRRSRVPLAQVRPLPGWTALPSAAVSTDAERLLVPSPFHRWLKRHAPPAPRLETWSWDGGRWSRLRPPRRPLESPALGFEADRRWLPITRCEARCAGASAWTLAAGRWPVPAHSFVGRDGTPSSFDQALTPALAVVPEGRLSGACMRSAWCLIVRSCLSSMNA